MEDEQSVVVFLPKYQLFQLAEHMLSMVPTFFVSTSLVKLRFAGCLVLNTHRYVKQLMAVGMTEAQAEAQVDIFIHFISDKLVTKQSLKETELVLKRDIKELDVKLETKIRELETKIKELEINLSSQIKLLEKEIIIKLGGMMVIGITVLAAMIKFL